MSSDREITANRLNAKRSTGPRSPAGKTKSSMNALTHGLTGRNVLLPGEDPSDFDSFREAVLANLHISGALEGALSDMIVAYLWRLDRVPKFEAMLYKRGYKELLVGQAAESVSRYESTEKERVLASLEHKKVAAGDRDAHADAQERLARARAELDDPAFNPTRVLESSPEAFLNLWRHETALLRSLLGTLHELERLQAKRAGQHVPVPVIVDVDVSVPEPARADVGGAGSGEPKANQH